MHRLSQITFEDISKIAFYIGEVVRVLTRTYIYIYITNTVPVTPTANMQNCQAWTEVLVLVEGKKEPRFCLSGSSRVDHFVDGKYDGFTPFAK